MAVSIEYVEKISKMKLEEDAQTAEKFQFLKNLVVFESEINTDKYKEARELADKAQLKITTFDEVLEAGKNSKDREQIEVTS